MEERRFSAASARRFVSGHAFMRAAKRLPVNLVIPSRGEATARNLLSLSVVLLRQIGDCVLQLVEKLGCFLRRNFVFDDAQHHFAQRALHGSAIVQIN